jgi:hypothetical protein
MQWKWKGPVDGGITQSLLGKYLQDPFSFVLYYGCGLEEPAAVNQNLIWGNEFHLLLELTLPLDQPYNSLPQETHDKLRAELTKYEERYSHVEPTTLYSVLEMMKLYNDSYKFPYKVRTEKQFKFDYSTKNHKVSLMGKIDGIGTPREDHTYENLPMGFDSDRPIIIEHKCKGYHDKAQHRQEIKTDLQLNLYLHAMQVLGHTTDQVVYDIIRIPEVQYGCPARNIGERIPYYINRIYNTCTPYREYPVSKNKFLWLDQHCFSHPENLVAEFRKITLDPIIDSLCYMYEYTLADSFDPFNPDCYNHLFHRRPLRLFDPARTDKFKKDYYQYLTGALPIESLVPVPHLFKELHGEG